MDLSSRTPPVAIILSAVKFANNPDKNLLAEPVIVAQVLSAPSVNGNDDILYQTASNELRINGTGFIGAKKVDLYFQPPLVKEVAYEDVTPYPLTKNQVVLRLRHGYSWRETPGALFVIGVDTGAGPVKVDGDAGAKVAEVVDNHDLHSVTVEPTVNEQLVYADEPDITISGNGFNQVGNLLRFANGLLGNNVNYTTISTTENKIKLRLTPGSHWRKNMENLPGALTLVAVNAGAGFVAVGPINSAKGRDVAMVFERPEVHSDQKKIYRRHSHELHIIGQGFPALETGYKVQLKFQPALVENVDYTMRVVDRTELELTLLDGRAWRPDAGSLMVTHINTRGDGAGWVDLPGAGVHVAEVVEDIDAATTGGIEIFPMGVKVYQSANRETIDITGTGFKDGLSLVLDPPMQVNSDYTLEVVSKNKIVLKLKGNKKWRAEPGFIIARSVKVDNKEYALAGTEGIRVAIVLADPVITVSKETLHETQSKLLVISGTGFTNVADVKITLNPTPAGSYKVIGVLEDAIRVQLKPDNDWLPSFMTLKDEEDSKKILLSVTSIDTGAGEIKFDPAVSIGYIIKDREGVVCDDSCEFAFDGVCDDGSEPNDEYYYQNYFNYQDDDMGGFYYEGEDGEEGNGKEAYGEEGEDSQYGVAYDDYYMENEDYQVSACVEGTDCTDCGGVDAIIDYTQPLDPNSGIESCTNTCIYPRDGVCDDPRGTKYCELGTFFLFLFLWFLLRVHFLFKLISDANSNLLAVTSRFSLQVPIARIAVPSVLTTSPAPTTTAGGMMTMTTGPSTTLTLSVRFHSCSFSVDMVLNGSLPYLYFYTEQNNGLEKNRHKVKTFKREEVVSTTDIFLVVLEGMVYTVGAIFAAAALYLLNRWYKGQSVPFMNAFSPELNQREFDLRPQQRMPITPDEFRT